MYSPPVLGGVVGDRGGYYIFSYFLFYPLRFARPPKTGGQYHANIFCALFYWLNRNNYCIFHTHNLKIQIYPMYSPPVLRGVVGDRGG